MLRPHALAERFPMMKAKTPKSALTTSIGVIEMAGILAIEESKRSPSIRTKRGRVTSRLRLRVNPQDRALVQAQGSTRRKFKPFAQSFGTKRASEANAALIVVSVNCHRLIETMQRILRTTQRPVDGDARLRLALVARYAAAALAARALP